MKTKSINCASCGGGIVTSSLAMANCSYCGNTNKILDDGVTLVITKKPKPKPNKDLGAEFGKLTTTQKIIVMGAIALMPIILKKIYKR